MIDIPLCILHDPNWGTWLSALNEESDKNYDFVFISHWGGLAEYDFMTQKYTYYKIDNEVLDVLRKLARMTTEGIIDDKDSVWEHLNELEEQ